MSTEDLPADYLIRVPAEWLVIRGAEAWIDADRLSGHEGRPFTIVAEIPGDVLSIRVEYDRPLQPGETRHSPGGNSVHMHSGPDCPCGWKLGGNGGHAAAQLIDELPLGPTSAGARDPAALWGHPPSTAPPGYAGR